MLGSKKEPCPGCVLISFLCGKTVMIIKTYIFLLFRIKLIFQFCSFWLLSKFGNMVIQLNFFLLGMLSGPEKIVRRIVFIFFIFSTKFKMADESHVTLKSLPASHICSKEATYPGHMLIRFWCDSDIIFLRGLHINFVTVLYFSIINVLCGVGGDPSFAPQANLVGFHSL